MKLRQINCNSVTPNYMSKLKYDQLKAKQNLHKKKIKGFRGRTVLDSERWEDMEIMPPNNVLNL